MSTLAIFQELHVDPTLFYIVFGESVLNDAVGIVLFTTFAKFIGFTYTASSTLVALLDFVLIFVGSTLVGVLLGLLSALLFKHFDFKTCTLHEVSMCVTQEQPIDLPHLVRTCFLCPGGCVHFVRVPAVPRVHSDRHVGRRLDPLCGHHHEALHAQQHQHRSTGHVREQHSTATLSLVTNSELKWTRVVCTTPAT